jgi:hypothetical protein
MKDLRRLHFKKDIRNFCFEALVDFCPVTGKEFYLRRSFLEKHVSGHRTPSKCFCSECGIFLYKDEERNKRGLPVFFGKIV